MKSYLELDEWKIIENGFHPEWNKMSESIYSIGNGRMGQRANFEEKYSGETFQGTYIAGVYYPDKTRVGWWKNGYPEYFAKVLNAINFIGLNITINNVELDLNTCKIISFYRELDMQHGLLKRNFTVELSNGNQVEVNAERFFSMVHDEGVAIKYSVKALNFSGTIEINSYLDGDIENEDSNYDEKFWDEVLSSASLNSCFLVTKTKKLDWQVATSMRNKFTLNGNVIEPNCEFNSREKYIEATYHVELEKNDEVTVYKYVAVTSSLNYNKSELASKSIDYSYNLSFIGYDKLKSEHSAKWLQKWELSDIKIEGDVAAQQGIRFNIFQLNQTYTGEDARLNIGPKGFTGEKYGGSTYWDTEAYCLPFYLNTSPVEVSKNLLIYRYNQLDKAIENAQKLGFTNGAALYPMVTMNGEECHNEWEITFEEIHRNGAIAYGIYNYVRHTNDEQHLADYGFEVLVGIARFWAQRVNWSAAKKQYVMLGVTGPNEYENNVNNNWYTNYLAAWCMKYTKEVADLLQEKYTERYNELVAKLNLNPTSEYADWVTKSENMFYPVLEGTNIVLQQEGYMDKEQSLVADLDPSQRPINQHWSWDRILRSCYIKQADVLQGMYFFEENFSNEVMLDNFKFYEERTLHESSLSPCVHVVLAAKLGLEDKAYEMYLRTARLDLDDYNHEADEGLHITSMAGTWMALVEGFGGLRVRNNVLRLNPMTPKNWRSYEFKILFRENVIVVAANANEVNITNTGSTEIQIAVYGNESNVAAGQSLTFKTV